ncbi:Putative adhesin [Halogranum rubrum]|uniref:Putative adhesin n=1 Tax=Halogranum rubrum TaxID=553466 RepID=A0A1I4ERC6_9EURY|nr:DUF4097 family beta strand repeat-containing protein [Halogranum rubrum]SFL07660.1 Putative adhesin [Halogranum rubrum]
MIPRSRRAFLALGGSLASAVLAGCTTPRNEVRERTTDTVDVGNATDLQVTSRNGSVTVTTWDRDAVELSVTKRTIGSRDAFDDVEVRTAVRNRSLAIETVYTTDRARRRVATDFELQVPSSLAVSAVETGNGRVDVTGTTGDGRFSTQNGRVTATDVDGFVTLTTSNGALESSGCTGVDGAKTSNGSIDLELLDIRRDVDISTQNGSIDVAVSGSLDADVVLAASNGNVAADGVELANTTRTPRRITGRLGDGGNRLRLSVTNGSAELTALDD